MCATEQQAPAHERGVCEALRALAARQLRSRFGIAAGALGRFASAPVFAAEAGANAEAHPRRWAAFRGGRACAREALRTLGQAPTDIPTGPMGAPRWPEGFVGSITHTDAFAAAVVAHSPPALGLGLDLETDAALDVPHMVELICRPEELGRCDYQDTACLERGKLLFVIKEAVYKLYQPIANYLLDFHDVRVVIDETTCTFGGLIVNPAAPAVGDSRTLSGSFVHAEGLYIALASRY